MFHWASPVDLWSTLVVSYWGGHTHRRQHHCGRARALVRIGPRWSFLIGVATHTGHNNIALIRISSPRATPTQPDSCVICLTIPYRRRTGSNGPTSVSRNGHVSRKKLHPVRYRSLFPRFPVRSLILINLVLLFLSRTSSSLQYDSSFLCAPFICLDIAISYVFEKCLLDSPPSWTTHVHPNYFI